MMNCTIVDFSFSTKSCTIGFSPSYNFFNINNMLIIIFYANDLIPPKYIPRIYLIHCIIQARIIPICNNRLTLFFK